MGTYGAVAFHVLILQSLFQVRDMVGGNPIVLVGTKMDLLPEGAAPKEVRGCNCCPLVFPRV